MTWMIYGAYGYTGILTAEYALERGHRPILAGRSAEKLAPLAERLGLDYRAFALDDEAAVRAALDGVEVVLNDAGPFVYTAQPMIDACLAAGVHYLDITGEIRVFEHSFVQDQAARERGITVMSGVGFDVVPTDCLAVYVAQQVADPTHLEVAFTAIGGASAGSTKTALEHLGSGGGITVRRDGHYTHIPMGSGAREVRFPIKGTRTVMPIPWGDQATAYRSTGIPNITTYMGMKPQTVTAAQMGGGLFRAVLGIKPVRGFAKAMVDRTLDGPDEATREAGMGLVWACARNDEGEAAEAWLKTAETYRFTAMASVQSVEQVLDGSYEGALTPAMAFGPDFVLEIEGTTRYDTLDNEE